MAKQKCTFPGRNCPSCPYHETVGVTRYCSGFPKKRKARRFRKSDPKYKPPKWCPRRISPPVCRVYGFKDQESELSAWLLNQDMTSGKGIGQKVSPTVLAYHYKLRLELPLAMTAKQFYEAENADRVVVMNDGRVDLDGTPEEVFSQVARLRHLGLTVPDTVDLLDRLRQKGWDVPLDALRAEDCAAAVAGALEKK